MKTISTFIQESLYVKANNRRDPEQQKELEKLWDEVYNNLNPAAGTLYGVYITTGQIQKTVIIYQTYTGAYKTAKWNSNTKKPEYISAAYKTKEEAMAYAERNKKNGNISWKWYLGKDETDNEKDLVPTKPHIQSNDPIGVVIPEIKGFKEQVQAIANAIDGAKLGKAITKRIYRANAKGYEIIHPKGIVEIIDGVYNQSYSVKGYARKAGLTIIYPHTPSYDGVQYPLNGTKTRYTTASSNTAGYFAKWINKNMDK